MRVYSPERFTFYASRARPTTMGQSDASRKSYCAYYSTIQQWHIHSAHTQEPLHSFRIGCCCILETCSQYLFAYCCAVHILYMVALPREFVILNVSVFCAVYSPDMEKCKRLRVVAVVKCRIEQKSESGMTLQRHQHTIYQHFGKCRVTFCYQQDVQVRD